MSSYTDLFEKVRIHMKWDDEKTKLWFHTENPLLGGMKPYAFLALRSEKAIKIIESMIEENSYDPET